MKSQTLSKMHIVGSILILVINGYVPLEKIRIHILESENRFCKQSMNLMIHPYSE